MSKKAKDQTKDRKAPVGTPTAQNDFSDVGYGRPPERTRFKRGQSGNPGGRPKGSLNLTTILERALRERVVINGRRFTMLEVAIKQLVKKSAMGDLSAAKQLLALVAAAEVRAASAGSNDEFSEEDNKVIQGILARFGKDTEGKDDN